MSDYNAFLARKQRRPRDMGFEVGELNANLFGWQEQVVRWCLRRGRAALFEDCGLGKTIQQLVWAEAVMQHTNQPVILHCPIGVRRQTLAEAERFGIGGCVIADDGSDVTGPAIYLVNYEKLHKFDASIFAGVVLDESSILKNFTGTRKQQILAAYEATPFRLACTATPAPNDLMELGNHCDFLGVMPSNEMLSRWFINDTMKAGGYRLKKHARDDYWRWVASWAVCLSKPSDIGGSDDGFDLPPLHIHDIIVNTPPPEPEQGWLFANDQLTATTVHKDKRRTKSERAEAVADLVNESSAAWVVWCDTNYEADELVERIPEAIEVRGADTASTKEERLQAFSEGRERVIISKPEIAGLGMNWQHCHNMAFIGLSYSYERTYQAIRRCWRFGQAKAVNCYMVSADTEHAIGKALTAKAKQHEDMQKGMAAAMSAASMSEVCGELQRNPVDATQPVIVPDWLKGGCHAGH